MASTLELLTFVQLQQLIASGLSGTTVDVQNLSSQPAAPGGGVTLWSSGGNLQVISQDGNSYDTERLTAVLGSNFTITSTSPQTVLAVPVAAGTYEVEAWLVTANATTSGATYAFSGPAAAAHPQLMEFESATSGTATIGYGASSTYTTGFNSQAVTGNQRVMMRATVQFTAGGTLAVTGAQVTGGDNATVIEGSRLRLCPVTT